MAETASDDQHSLLTASIRRFEEAESATVDARKESERDRDYYDSKQWTDTEKAALRKRGQPVVTFNRIQRKVNYLKGLEAQTRKDPRAYPRTPGDDGSAQAATDALRFVCDDNQWDAIRSEAFENIMVEGTGAVFVGVTQGKQGIDPSLIHIAWDRLYHDPYSRRVDFSDAAYIGLVTWKDADEAIAAYPGKDEVIEVTLNGAPRDSTTFDDRPQHNIWADAKRKRVRICEEYYREGGKWMRCVFTQGGFLEECAPSPYIDEDGQPECPIKAISAYVDRDNNRYGEVRAMISPQDEVNKRRSKGLHLINSRQVRVSRGSPQPISEIRRELAKPDGVLIADAGELEVLNTGDMAAANLQMLQEAKAEIDLLGPNAALAGKNENDSSGRAILAQQQGGMVEVALLMDRLRALSLAVYRAIWARIKQYWTEQRWIRVTDDERNLQWVGLNAPKTLGDLIGAAMQGDDKALQTLGQKVPPAAQMVQAAAQGDEDARFKLAMAMRDPRMAMPVHVENPVGEMDVDIIIDEGIDTPTIQSEQFDMLAKMMPSLTQLPPPYAKLLIQASSLRDKDKLLELLDQVSAPDPQAQQLQQVQQGMELDNAQAEIDHKKAQTVKTLADADAKRAGVVNDMMAAQMQARDQAIQAGAGLTA